MSSAMDAETAYVPPDWADGPEPKVSRYGLRWWKELLAAALFYGVYSFIRNTQGSASVSRTLAFRNARRIIDFERVIGFYHERAIQHLFVGWAALMSVWNLFYGTFHFIVTIFVLVMLFRRFPARYRFWRNALAATTALALIGFALYPLMPPRLLPSSYGFVDSLEAFGSLWSFDSAAMQKISNQYAAMPSLHFAWSLWCACALLPALRRRRWKLAIAAYPLLTLAAIVITANHYIIDAVAGAAILAGGYAYATVAARVGRRPAAVPVVAGGGSGPHGEEGDDRAQGASGPLSGKVGGEDEGSSRDEPGDHRAERSSDALPGAEPIP